jgi:hypothetical protein
MKNEALCVSSDCVTGVDKATAPLTLSALQILDKRHLINVTWPVSSLVR